jgi:hypothetical protein
MKITINTYNEKQLKSMNCDSMEIIHCYKADRDIDIIHSIDNGKHHISISTPNRQPSWNEIKSIKYQLLPYVNMAIMFPPKDEYVDVHKYCFHIYEL